MASLSEHAAAPDSGYQDISALADVWAAMAVQAALEPDHDEVLFSLAKMLQRLAASPIQTDPNGRGLGTAPGWGGFDGAALPRLSSAATLMPLR
jgi:hypothetical protein